MQTRTDTASNVNHFGQSVCKLDTTNLRTDRTAAANSTYPKVAALCSKDSFVVNGSFVFPRLHDIVGQEIKFGGKSPALRVAANRCIQFYRTSATKIPDQKSPLTKKMSNNTSQHILGSSANLLGFCLFVITSLHIANVTELHIINKVTSVVAVLLTFSCIFSFISIRTSNEQREKRLETIADYLFLILLLGILTIILLIAFNYFK